jgi:hypothetical protein
MKFNWIKRKSFILLRKKFGQMIIYLTRLKMTSQNVTRTILVTKATKASNQKDPKA